MYIYVVYAPRLYCVAQIPNKTRAVQTYSANVSCNPIHNCRMCQYVTQFVMQTPGQKCVYLSIFKTFMSINELRSDMDVECGCTTSRRKKNLNFLAHKMHAGSHYSDNRIQHK